MERGTVADIPVSEETVTQEFIDGAAAFLDELLALGEPATRKDRQFLGGECFVELCRAFDVCDEQPAGL